MVLSKLASEIAQATDAYPAQALQFRTVEGVGTGTPRWQGDLGKVAPLAHRSQGIHMNLRTFTRSAPRGPSSGLFHALCGALALLGATAALAQTPPTLSQQQVKLLANTCASCHGTDGGFAGPIPAIAGRPAEVLSMQLLNYKHRAPAGTTVMDRIAKGYTDEELRALASHFSSIRK